MEEIKNYDNLDKKEVAEEFYEKMWEKMKKFKVVTAETKVFEPEFLTNEQKDIYKEYLENPDEYKSYAVQEFLLDTEGYEKKHMYRNERIGRYPVGFRQYENFANYSTWKESATI